MQDYYVHPTAIVEEGAAIGNGTKIWHFSHVMGGSEMGEGCNLGQNVFVAAGVKLGKNVKVQNNVSIYTGVICEDDVFLGPSAVLTNVINPRSAVNRKNEYQTTYLERGVTVGANATIVCGHRLGRYAFIGAGAVVTKDVPAYALMIGTPARQTGWMSEHGQRLSFGPLGRAVCPESGIAYQLERGRVHRLTEAERLARDFAHALDCDDFEKAGDCVAEDAEYQFREEVIRGRTAIIAQYRQNMEKGRAQLDELEWGKGEITYADEQRAEILFVDYLRHQGRTHTHRCKQMVYVAAGKAGIVRIEHLDLEGEAAALKAFLGQS